MSIDGAWHAVLNAFVAQDLDLRFGRDFIYTIGPLGFLRHQRYFPGNQIYHILWGVVLTGAFVTVYHELFRRLPFLYRWLGLIAFLTLPSFVGSAGKILSPLSVAFLYVLAIRKAPTLSFVDVYMSFVLATSAWIMFSQFVASVFVAFTFTAFHYIRFKILSPVPLIFATFLLGWWLMLDQSLADLPAYVTYGVSFAQGYADAMLTFGSWWQEIASVIACFCLYLLSVVLYGNPEKPTVKLALIVTMSGIFFLVFKHSIVGHVQDKIGTSAVVVMVVTICHQAYVLRMGNQRFHLGWLSVPIAAAVFVSVWILASPRDGLGGAIRDRVEWHQRQASGLFHPVRTSERLRAKDRQRRNRARARFPLPPPDEAVDWFGNRQGVLIAHNIETRFRPVFQRFAAYTEELAELNAAFYRSDRAPRLVIVHLSAQDRSFRRRLRDARAQIELAQSYGVVDRYGDLLLLASRDRKPFTFTEVDERTIGFGQEVHLAPYSEARPIWARIILHRSFLGKLSALAFKPPMLWLQLRYGDGRKKWARFPATLARGGFLLSPQITTTGEFETFMREGDPSWTPSQRVISFRVDASAASQRFLLRHVSIRVSTIRRHEDAEAGSPW